jgi:hypothetical protein
MPRWSPVRIKDVAGAREYSIDTLGGWHCRDQSHSADDWIIQLVVEKNGFSQSDAVVVSTQPTSWASSADPPGRFDHVAVGATHGGRRLSPALHVVQRKISLRPDVELARGTRVATV